MSLPPRPLRALCLPGCGCRGAFQFGVMQRLWERGERFDIVAGASSGAICGAAEVVAEALATWCPDRVCVRGGPTVGKRAVAGIRDGVLASIGDALPVSPSR